MTWFTTNFLGLIGTLLAVGLGIHTVFRAIQSRKDYTNGKKVAESGQLLDAENDQLTLTFNAIIKNNELLAAQNSKMDDLVNRLRRSHQSLMAREFVREQREIILLNLLGADLETTIPKLPTLPPIIDP